MEGAIALVIVTLVGNLVVLGAILIPLLREPRSDADRAGSGPDVQDRLAAAAVTGTIDDPLIDGASAHAYDRVVRVVSWVFILVTAALVLATTTSCRPMRSARPSSWWRARSP